MGRNSKRARDRFDRASKNRCPKASRRHAGNSKTRREAEARLKAATTIGRLPRTLVARGRVTWTWVPYMENPQEGKSRPVVILDVNWDTDQVEVAMLSTTPTSDPRGRYSLTDWDQYGLTRPTAVLHRRLWVPVESCTTNVGYIPDAVLESAGKFHRWGSDAQ